MLFQIAYMDLQEPSIKNKNISLLENFLNYHLSEQFHGWAFDQLYIELFNNAPPLQKMACKNYGKHAARIELAGVFKSNRAMELQDLHQGFQLIMQAAEMAGTIPLKGRKQYLGSKLLDDLHALKTSLPSTSEELEDLYAAKATMEAALVLREVDGYLNACKDHPRRLTKTLTGIRVYEDMTPGPGHLAPYTHLYNEIFNDELKQANIKTPHYKEIYFAIGTSLEDAKQKVPLVKHGFYRYTYCSIEMERYHRSDATEKEGMVFESLCEGLRLMAATDHLDEEKIENVISRVRGRALRV